ncbi:restriction endonuclease subunit S [Dietzia maris]|uniref:Restriction endonuclease subunit S n=1 Tax=Dietzia maris TaxID=37915 RepID=A0A365PAC8_9ACTN|nr:restriction endonuclease subunit S [Dietzia maris]
MTRTTKTSALEWLDSIPSDWDEREIGRDVWVRARLGWKGLTAGEYVESGIPMLATPNIKSPAIQYSQANKITQERYDESPEIMLKNGDVLLTKDGSTIGTVNIVRDLVGPATVNGSIAVLTATGELEGRYLYWFIASSYAQSIFDRLRGGMGVPHLFQRDINRIRMPRPGLSEQRSIVDYLDRETARIDALIEEQEHLIEMLHERRHALVSRAVCFGVDEDVELRDSGDPMIGIVPLHWTVKAVRHWMESLNGQRIPLSGEERADRRGDFDYYGASGVIDKIDDYLFDEPLVLVSEDGANLLMRSTPIAFTAKGRYWVNNHAHVLRPRISGNIDFWANRLDALDVTTVVSGSAQPKLTAGALMGLRVSAPDDVAEQSRIAEYLAEETARIDALILEAERFIELSKERRSALITAAVTGQIDVRGMA